MESDDDWDDIDSCWYCPRCDTWHDLADEGCTCERDEQTRQEGAAAERARIVAAIDEAWRKVNAIEGYGHMDKPITDFGRGLEAAAAIVESMPEQGEEE